MLSSAARDENAKIVGMVDDGKSLVGIGVGVHPRAPAIHSRTATDSELTTG